MADEVAAWVDDAVWLDAETYAVDPGYRSRTGFIDAVGEAGVVFLGETNHFVHEKMPFRLWWLRRLGATRRLVVGEELGWSDARRIRRYLADGNETHLDRVVTFGYDGHRRDDRDETLSGVFAGLDDHYPHTAMKAEHGAFYRELRALGVVEDFFGFDIDSPGGAYADMQEAREQALAAGLPAEFWSAVGRVPGETRDEEVGRLRDVAETFGDEPGFELVREDLVSLIESLEYTMLLDGAADYAATAPAMSYREQTMKRRVDDVLARMPSDTLLVLLGHAFHLAKSDRAIVAPGVRAEHSLGEHLHRERGLPVKSVWMIYGAGRDSQPLPDLPNVASYPSDSINERLRRYGRPMVLPVGEGALREPVRVGHLYNQVAKVDLAVQADAVMFFPEVSPLRGVAAPDRA